MPTWSTGRAPRTSGTASRTSRRRAGSRPRLVAPAAASRWGVFEAELHGPAHGNPFTDVELAAEFHQAERVLRVPGSFDGDGVHRIRFMPDREGPWRFRTASNARSLDGIEGGFECTKAAPGDHGPVRVHDTFHFRHADGTRCIPLGIEADLILFHPYDRWGFSDMGAVADDRYVRYVVARLAAFQNVWWALANEYDLVSSKGPQDWERLAGVITANDPYGHLLSNHNCRAFFDNDRPWVTHASLQRVDVYRTAENTDLWRERWSKPVVIDECAYEGDLDQGWGNITAEELVRRCWEGAVRGGYVGHGETYVADDEVLWWSKGGELKGDSPPRIAFLRRVLEEGPEGGLDPLPSEWDLPWAGVAGEHYLAYFGFSRPRFRTFTLPPGAGYHVDVIDTWGMTVDTLEGSREGTFRVELPARQYMAVRMRRA